MYLTAYDGVNLFFKLFGWLKMAPIGYLEVESRNLWFYVRKGKCKRILDFK